MLESPVLFPIAPLNRIENISVIVSTAVHGGSPSSRVYYANKSSVKVPKIRENRNTEHYEKTAIRNLQH